MALSLTFCPPTTPLHYQKSFISAAIPQALTKSHLHSWPRHPSTHRRVKLPPRADATERSPEELAREEQIKSVERMRSRLEGLFGTEETEVEARAAEDFDGRALRNAILERWGVQYDVQPQKRHGRVYVQIMWRYFEQQSFYMGEDEFASHCEAVALLLKQWNAVDYFCDYIASIKKRPVVGITINIPIPGIRADSAVFE